MKKDIFLTALAVLSEFAVMLAAVAAVRTSHDGSAYALIQNLSYISLILASLALMRLSGRGMAEFGLRRDGIVRQIALGAAISAAVLLVFAVLGWRPHAVSGFACLAVSQALVALSEELMFRGFILTMLADITGRSDRAVLISAAIFGLAHYPVGQNLSQVAASFLFGGVFGALRVSLTGRKNEIGIPALAMAHWTVNVLI